MPVAAAQAFIRVIEAGAAESLPYAVAAERAVLAGRPVAVRLLQPVGVPASRGDRGGRPAIG